MVDTDIEAMVLGTVLRTGDSACREISFLSVDDFGLEKHRLVFRTMSDLCFGSSPHNRRSVLPPARNRKDRIRRRVHWPDGSPCGRNQGMPLPRFAQRLRALAIDRKTWRLNAQLSKLIESGYAAASAEVQAVIRELAQGDSGVGPGSAMRIAELPPVRASQDPIYCLREPELPFSAIVGLTGDSVLARAHWRRPGAAMRSRKASRC